MELSVEQIIDLYASRGVAWYGREAVSQLEHALQCATLAEESGASPELVAACFLHDLGHLLVALPHEVGECLDDRHELYALPFLSDAYGEAVLQPIRLHVEAKRFLCLAEPGYWQSLSAASKHSLQLQGGIFSPIEAERFESEVYAADAVKLRRWDDQAKTPGRVTRTLGDMEALLAGIAERGAPGS
jgi:phosphonate degradation associated HDIG domain protein